MLPWARAVSGCVARGAAHLPAHALGRPAADSALAAGIEVIDSQFYPTPRSSALSSPAGHYPQPAALRGPETALVRLMLRIRELLNGLEGGQPLMLAPPRRLLRLINRNTKGHSRSNGAVQDDLGTGFFRLTLGETLACSRGVYPTSTNTLHEAGLKRS
jgi:cyclopropane-fatty-acyl-phospholipid synthase